MTPRERSRFDALLEHVLANLPERVRAVLNEVPLVVDDHPEPDLVRELYDEMAQARGETLEQFAESLCGLHTGVPLTERSVEAPADPGANLPTEIRIFREGVVHLAGGWEPGAGETPADVDDAVYDEIAITLLHEIGHHFGLDEADLEELGYD